MTDNANSTESVVENVEVSNESSAPLTTDSAADAILAMMTPQQEDTQQEEPTSDEQVDDSGEEEHDDTDNPEDSEDEDAETDGSEEQQEEEEYFQVTVKDEDGNDVVEDVSGDELVKGYMRNKDYHRKRTMEAKQVKEQISELTTVRDNLEATMAANLSLEEQTLQQLGNQLQVAQQQRPDLYPELHYKYLQLSQEVANKRNTVNQLRQSYMAQRQEEEQSSVSKALSELQTIYPDWEHKQQELSGYLSNQGFSNADVRGMVNPKIVELVEKAMAYDNQQATLKDAGYKKLKRKVPKVLKSGTGNAEVAANKSKGVNQATDQLRKTGSVDDAANALLAMFNK